MYDFSGDMGLESSVSDQSAVQSSIDPSGDTTTTIGLPDIEYNLKPGFVTNYIKDLLKTNLVRDIQRNRQGQITGVRSVHNPFSPSSFFGSVTGGKPSAGIMGLVGSVVGPPGMSLAPGILGALTDEEVTTYTGYNPDDESESTGKSNFSGSGNNDSDGSDNEGLPEANRRGILGTINTRNTSDILREYLQAMDNRFELRPGEFLRRAS